MTTARQARKFFAPLVDRHDDLFVSGRWLILKPLRHVLRGFVLGRTSSADLLSPRWAVANLCEPQDTFPLSWGEMLCQDGHPSWSWDDPNLQTELFAAAIEGEALPRLRAIETLE